MTLCVCGHPSEQHHRYDAGWYCEGGCPCDWYREAVDSEESTASLPAGVTPEGLAEETVAGSVNEVTPPTDEARAEDDIAAYAAWRRDPNRVTADDVTDEARAPEQKVEPQWPWKAGTWAGEQHHLWLHSIDGFVTELDDETPTSGYCPADPSEKCGYVSTLWSIEREAAAVAVPPLDVERLAQAIATVIWDGHLLDLATQSAGGGRTQRRCVSQPSPDDPDWQ